MNPKRIAIVLELAVGYREDVLRGLWKYVDIQQDWVCHGMGVQARELALLRKWKPDGVIAGIDTRDVGISLQRLGKPIVDIFNCFNLSKIVKIGVDDPAVGRMAAEYFLRRSLKNFGVTGRMPFQFSEEREAGFADTLKAAGFSYTTPGAAAPSISWSAALSSDVDQTLQRWLSELPRPAGIFAITDTWGFQVLETCRRCGLRVPDDIAVLGVDNDSLRCQMARPPLSSIATAPERIGYQAGELLGQMMAGAERPKCKLLPPTQVIERQSTNILAIDDVDVLAAVRFIRANTQHSIGVSEVLRVVPLRRRTLERRFQKCVGRSILGEIQDSRIERARALLTSTDLKLSAVAVRSGFGGAQQLCRVFHRITGKTPAEFRRRKDLSSMSTI